MLLWMDVWVSPTDTLRFLIGYMLFVFDYCPFYPLGDETESFELKEPLPIDDLFIDFSLNFLEVFEMFVCCFFIEDVLFLLLL